MIAHKPAPLVARKKTLAQLVNVGYVVRAMQIDNHIAPPRPQGKRYPFRVMQPGQSVFFPGKFSHLNASRAYMAAKTIQKRSDTITFQGKRVIEDGQPGIRIWRVT